MGIAAGIFFYALFWSGKRKYFWPVVAVGILSVGWLWQSGRINLKGNYSVEGGDSISVRSEMWTESWRMIKDHYVLGAGLGGYQELMKNYHQKNYIEIYLYPHNIFLNFWSEIGIFGLLAFLGILFWYYKRALIKQKDDLRFKIYDLRDLRILLAAAMTVVVVHGLVDVPYFKNDLSVFFWILIGAMWIENIRQKEAGGV
jgi:O-antigen ligase